MPLKKKINKTIQTEVDACFLYSKLAENETDEVTANVFRKMSEIEKNHAQAFFAKSEAAVLPPPSFRAKVLNRIGKIFGYDYVLGMLMDTEKSISNAIITDKKRRNLPVTGTETTHVTILRSLAEKEPNVSGQGLARFEKQHRSVGGNALRAAVLGGNDGLVSNFSLVMGIAGATNGGEGVLLAGIAGLLAGALSMSLGEWISVKSSQELYENQMQLEMEEMETNPENEQIELALIYMAKGIPESQAHEMAGRLMSDKNLAHEVLVREELGINPEELKGSAMEAAVYSFILFAIGAIIPVFPFFFYQWCKRHHYLHRLQCSWFIFNRVSHNAIHRKKYLALRFTPGYFWSYSCCHYIWNRKIDWSLFSGVEKFNQFPEIPRKVINTEITQLLEQPGCFDITNNL